jgi:hypothetical protein
MTGDRAKEILRGWVLMHEYKAAAEAILAEAGNGEEIALSLAIAASLMMAEELHRLEATIRSIGVLLQEALAKR